MCPMAHGISLAPADSPASALTSDRVGVRRRLGQELARLVELERMVPEVKRMFQERVETSSMNWMHLECMQEDIESVAIDARTHAQHLAALDSFVGAGKAGWPVCHKVASWLMEPGDGTDFEARLRKHLPYLERNEMSQEDDEMRFGSIIRMYNPIRWNLPYDVFGYWSEEDLLDAPGGTMSRMRDKSVASFGIRRWMYVAPGP